MTSTKTLRETLLEIFTDKTRYFNEGGRHYIRVTVVTCYGELEMTSSGNSVMGSFRGGKGEKDIFSKIMEKTPEGVWQVYEGFDAGWPIPFYPTKVEGFRAGVMMALERIIERYDEMGGMGEVMKLGRFGEMVVQLAPGTGLMMKFGEGNWWEPLVCVAARQGQPMCVDAWPQGMWEVNPGVVEEICEEFLSRDEE